MTMDNYFKERQHRKIRMLKLDKKFHIPLETLLQDVELIVEDFKSLIRNEKTYEVFRSHALSMVARVYDQAHVESKGIAHVHYNMFLEYPMNLYEAFYEP